MQLSILAECCHFCSMPPPKDCRASIYVLPRCCSKQGLHDEYVSIPTVSSYLTFPPLPKNRRLFSVALSLRSPSAAVSRYSALWSPDFPRRKSFQIFPRNCTIYSHIYFKSTIFFCQYFIYHLIII